MVNKSGPPNIRWSVKMGVEKAKAWKRQKQEDQWASQRRPTSSKPGAFLFSYLDATSISIRGCVRPSVRTVFVKTVKICGCKLSEHIREATLASRILCACIRPRLDACLDRLGTSSMNSVHVCMPVNLTVHPFISPSVR